MSRNDDYRENEYEIKKTDEMENTMEPITEEKKEEKTRSSSRRRATDETVKKKGKIIKTTLLNVRSTPRNEDDKNIVSQLKGGEIVEIIGSEDGYYKINYNGSEAYILSDFCEEV